MSLSEATPILRDGAKTSCRRTLGRKSDAEKTDNIRRHAGQYSAAGGLEDGQPKLTLESEVVIRTSAAFINQHLTK